MYGVDVKYCPRTVIKDDDIFHEDPISEFNSHYTIEMYVKNVEGFEGEGEFLSKFNIQIRDQITFTVAQRVYTNEIGKVEGFARPREGDIIYFPLPNKIYQVKYVEHEAPNFYQMGSLQVYDLQCEQFEYSNEKLNTGIDFIDRWGELHSLDLATNNLADKDVGGNLIIDADTGRPSNISDSYDLTGDPFAENSQFKQQSDFIDFSEIDPFSDGQIGG